MPPSPSADTPLLNMLVEEGRVSEERVTLPVSLEPVLRKESRDIVPERRVVGWDKSEYDKAVRQEREQEADDGMDFVSVGMHVPGGRVVADDSMSVGSR